MSLHRRFTAWIPLAIAITVLCGTFYVAIQQEARQTFNEEQIAAAEGAAAALQQGLAASLVDATKPRFDIKNNTSLFGAVYDDSGKPLESTGFLGDENTLPVPPARVFAYARAHGEDRVTWQPRSDVRIAMMLIHYGSSTPGFVLAGRNMRDLERRAYQLTVEIAFGWIAALVLSLGAALIVSSGT